MAHFPSVQNDDQTLLGVLAFQGDLPRILVGTRPQACFVVAFKDYTCPDWLEGVDHAWFSLGHVGAVLRTLRQKSIHHLVLAGGLKRPSFKTLSMDWKGMQLATRLLTKVHQGDDQWLRVIVTFLEEEGFKVVAPQDIMPSLQGNRGVLGNHFPAPQSWQDIHRGVHLLQTLSPFDIGQSVVVCEGHIWGIEGPEGTDALIERVKLFPHHDVGPVLVKAPKVGQESRVDAPTLGMRTIDNLIKAGFAGVAFDIKGSLLLEEREMIKKADASGLFLVGIEESLYL